jgi:hypothetical protein
LTVKTDPHKGVTKVPITVPVPSWLSPDIGTIAWPESSILHGTMGKQADFARFEQE